MAAATCRFRLARAEKGLVPGRGQKKGGIGLQRVDGIWDRTGKRWWAGAPNL